MDLINVSCRGKKQKNVSIQENWNSSEWLSSWRFCTTKCPANAPHRGSFSLWRGYTTADTWANWESNAKLRGALGVFCTDRIRECVCVCVLWCRGCCQTHRQHNECSISLLPEKKTHVRWGWLCFKYQLPPSKSWWIYISPWALHLLVIQLICVHLLQHTDWPLSVIPAGQSAELLSIYLFLIETKTNWVNCGLIKKKPKNHAS